MLNIDDNENYIEEDHLMVNDHLVDDSSGVNLILTSCGLVSPSTLYASSMSTSSTLAMIIMIGQNTMIGQHHHDWSQRHYNHLHPSCPAVQSH